MPAGLVAPADDPVAPPKRDGAAGEQQAHRRKSPPARDDEVPGPPAERRARWLVRAAGGPVAARLGGPVRPGSAGLRAVALGRRDARAPLWLWLGRGVPLPGRGPRLDALGGLDGFGLRHRGLPPGI